MDGNKAYTGAGFDMYKDIKNRTDGEIYLGIVGPVRTGKSTFIRRFMEMCVLPVMLDDNEKKRATDELPQASGGTTIMTTEPKFIPKEAALISPFEGINLKVRMVDCVGYMIAGANGHMENGVERMVKTPWTKEDIPFSKAAEIGTRKVIKEHSTIGIVVTTDGSITGIERKDYIPAEEKTIAELQDINKPFVVLLNCVKPYSKETETLAKDMALKYKVPVIPVNCDQLKQEDVNRIFENILKEFPVRQIDFHTPAWTEVLPSGHWLKKELCQAAVRVLEDISTIKDADQYEYNEEDKYIKQLTISDVDMAQGLVSVDYDMNQGIYYDILSELTGTDIKNEYELIYKIKRLRIIDNEPFALETVYTPEKMCAGLKEVLKEEDSLYRVFREEYNHKIEKAIQTIEPITLNKESSKLLNRDINSLALKFDRKVYTKDQSILEYTISIFTSDKHQYQIMMTE